MSLYHKIAYIFLVVLVSYPVDADATTNFSQCFTGVTNCANNSCLSGFNIPNTTALLMLRTSKGIPSLIPAEATALSYTGCVQYCGPGQEEFNWTVFSQEYAVWLLPYLALLSQLPFGARRRVDNLMSVMLTLGSPTLAGYSLYLTLLNSRWLNDQLFRGIDYPSAAVRRSVVQVLSGLQQVPLRIHPGNSARFESLVVHPDNDEWWATLASELDFSHMWSIASATSITWVFIAYLLTVADSLSNVADNINSNGEGTGSVWLWLLPIVVGWFILSPKCDYGRIHDAYHKANRQAFAIDPNDPEAPPTRVTSNFGITIDPSPDWSLHDVLITSPDELRTPPVFNYARLFSWSRTAYHTSLFYRAAYRKSNRRVAVDGEYIAVNIHNDIPRESRIGTRDQTIRYCRPDDHEYPRTSILWPRGVFFNMILASLMSLQLQWGTTFSAILAAWFTPTIGLGCRSLAYLMYGLLSTTVWILLVSSSILGYYACHLIDDQKTSLYSENVEQHTTFTSSQYPKSKPMTRSKVGNNGARVSEEGNGDGIPLQEVQSGQVRVVEDTRDAEDPAAVHATRCPHTVPVRARIIAWATNLLRWTGKLLAIINAIGIIANSVLQYANVYDTCYCNSSVYTWRSSAFNVITPITSDIDLATKAWIGALALALTCCMFFVGTIYLLRDSLPRW